MILLKVCGIIAEYNPLHNGHLYQISTVKQTFDAIVVVMSGNFLQRGEPAIVNKWIRTLMALKAGADLVIELPAIYATASSFYFAWGAVNILNTLPCVNAICFGSEIGRIEILQQLANLLVQEPEELRELLFKYQSNGNPYPKALSQSLQQYYARFLPDEKNWAAKLPDILCAPNNILGIEYLKCLTLLGSNIEPLTIKRIGGFHDLSFQNKIASAKAIRSKIFSDPDSSYSYLSEVIPDFTLQLLKHEMEDKGNLFSLETFSSTIISFLRRAEKEELKKSPDVGEGLENRLKRCSACGSIEEIIRCVKTKRYPWTRIQRILIHYLLGITSEDYKALQYPNRPQYIRVLGFNQTGRQILADMRKNVSVPIIIRPSQFNTETKISSLQGIEKQKFKRMLSLDMIATDIYFAHYMHMNKRQGGKDYLHPVIML